MKKQRCLTFLLAILLTSYNALIADTDIQAEKALRKSCDYLLSISTCGGYDGRYSLDLKKRYGESFREEASETQIWVQPPGTPSVGECLLRAYRLTNDEKYLKGAESAAKALAWGQSSHGGWQHLADVATLIAGDKLEQRQQYSCTIDDNITQGAISFLIKLDLLIDREWLTQAIQLGLDFLLENQYSNGAWSQWYPLRGGYHDYYTFNDNAINDCIRVLLLAHRQYGNPEFLSSAELAGSFIINSQYPAPQAGWAQQYNHDMQPAWARDFEPPGICSLATARNIVSLVNLYRYTGKKSYLDPIPVALDWLEESKLAPNTWARLYEVGTNRPIYGDMDRKVHYNYEEISPERKTGYGFRGDFHIQETIAYYKAIKAGSIAEYGEKSKEAKAFLPRVEEAISHQDKQGRWLRQNSIHIQDFVRNINSLCDYLELIKTDKNKEF